MSDPNFPPNLNIHPLHILSSSPSQETTNNNTSPTLDTFDQAEAIVTYGIAGRVWEAGKPLLEYLSPPKNSQTFDPPCSFFTPASSSSQSSSNRTPFTILELGSGQALPALHLASLLSPQDTIVLTDLPNVIPLCQQSVKNWEKGEKLGDHGKVVVKPLAWGESVDQIFKFGPFTHILLCDLVYFPHLYPPLLRTLLELTEPHSIPSPEVETFGPEIILSYKTRSIALEQSFFDAFGQYFRMTPVTGAKWDVEDDARIYICSRWRITEEWRLPSLNQVMGLVRGVVKGRSFDRVDEMYAALEWD